MVKTLPMKINFLKIKAMDEGVGVATSKEDFSLGIGCIKFKHNRTQYPLRSCGGVERQEDGAFLLRVNVGPYTPSGRYLFDKVKYGKSS